MNVREDRAGHTIGGYDDEASYHVENFEGLPIEHQVQKSLSTESVYVIYWRADIDVMERKLVKVRFSWHDSNDDVIDGNNSSARNEILSRLGFLKKKVIPYMSKKVLNRYVAKKKVKDFEMCELTINEIYELPVGTDISNFTGKLAKDSNILILGNKVENVETGRYKVEYVE